MQFDDHEIWGAPVQAPAGGLPDAPAPAEEPAVASPEAARAGRLYKSAGCEAQVDAIVALPGHHKKHTAALPVEPTIRPANSSAPVITVNSRIPRPAPIDDPAIAEVLAAPAAAAAPAPSAPSGFTSWFRQSAATPRTESAPAAAPVAAPATAPASATSQPAASRVADVASIAAGFMANPLAPASYAVFVFAITTVIGILEARISGSVGTVTGAAFAIVSGIGAWRLLPQHRWAGWVLPSYTLIASGLVAGQFAAGAPGASVIGQALIVVATLITLAPWLLAAGITGIVLPIVRGRRA